MKHLTTFIFVIFLMTTGAFTQQKEVRRSQFLMGSICEIQASGNNEQKLKQGIQKAFDEIRRLENILSTYIPTSEVSHLNHDEPMFPSETLTEILDISEHYSEQTEGAFNVRFQRTGKLNFGGIGKGYALDKAIFIFKDHNIQQVKINFGGQISILSRTAQNIQVAHPEHPQQTLADIRLANGSVATSSQRAHWNIKTGESRDHIKDPRSGQKSEFTGSVTVVSKTATEADALSTALHVMGLKKGIAFADKKNVCSLFYIPTTEVLIYSEQCKNYSIKVRRNK